jgi:hypothetical protein
MSNIKNKPFLLTSAERSGKSIYTTYVPPIITFISILIAGFSAFISYENSKEASKIAIASLNNSTESKNIAELSLKVLSESRKMAELSYNNSKKLIKIENLSLNTALEYKRIANESHKTSRLIAGLELTPTILLRATFYKIKNVPPHIRITNNGPIDTNIVELQIEHIRYKEDKDGNGKISMRMSASEDKIVIKKLSTLQPPTMIPIPDKWLNMDRLEILHSPLEHNILEIKVTYKRYPDMMEFTRRCYYFINPKKIWVPEDDNTLTPKVYEKIKRVIFESVPEQNIFDNNIKKYIPEDLDTDPSH